VALLLAALPVYVEHDAQSELDGEHRATDLQLCSRLRTMRSQRQGIATRPLPVQDAEGYAAARRAS
jgi:hypothetical protein